MDGGFEWDRLAFTKGWKDGLARGCLGDLAETAGILAATFDGGGAEGLTSGFSGGGGVMAFSAGEGGIATSVSRAGAGREGSGVAGSSHASIVWGRILLGVLTPSIETHSAVCSVRARKPAIARDPPFQNRTTGTLISATVMLDVFSSFPSNPDTGSPDLFIINV
ncbi:hypothetical protein CCP4SC76_7440009 [Gammaproteobacteria bacterium]